MGTLHQFLAGFTNGDAISRQAVIYRRFFRAWGHNSDIFSNRENILPSLRGEAMDVSRYTATGTPDDIILLHLSSGSPVNEAFAALHCRKALIYHNITPAHYFDVVNRQTAQLLVEGRKQVQALAGSAMINLAVSQYDAADLESMGYRDVKVFPIIIDFDLLETPPDRSILSRFSDGVTNILFVGRGAPNKKIEDVVKTFHYYHTNINPSSRMIHVGSYTGTEAYYLYLKRMVRELRIEKHVRFTGSIDQAGLNAIYRCAHIFLCMSEHEGFCIPLLESMYFNIPVVAFSTAAVPETLANSGITFTEKNHKILSELLASLMSNSELRQAVLNRQSRRIREYRVLNLENELKRYLAPLIDNGKTGINHHK